MARCYSAYYFFKVQREHLQDTKLDRVKYIMKSCSNDLVSHLQLVGDSQADRRALLHSHHDYGGHNQTLALEELQKTWVQSWDPTQVEEAAPFARHVLGYYHFVGVTERFDESLVALKWLLGLELRDILHISAKRPGMRDDRNNPVRSHPGPENEADPVIRKYLQTEFQKRNVQDFAVFHEVR
eukprot:INCI6067.2.p1 GENE.INCI6067.2~~INCI6067.2.p1  ORF type:complete len:183 (-),score=24.20 INCI6067.2:317-865(-)